MENRIEWVDIAKGIGIILVIAGHCFYLGYSYPLYAFHMPLFFFLSGLLFKDKKEGFGDFFKRKTKSLMRPWLIILFISFLVCLAIPQWRNEITLKAVLSDLYTANTNVFQNSSLWYLVCFYFMLLFFFFVKKIKMSTSFAIVSIILAVGLLWIKELLDMTNLPFHRFPFKIDSALVALVFFYVAYLLKEKINSFITRKINLLLILLIVLVAAALCVLNGWSNINSLDFGRIRLLYFPIAFMGVASVCLVSSLIITRMKWKPLNSFLAYYGKNSLLIFGFQSLFIRLYILVFSNLGGGKMELYANYPFHHQVGAFLVVTFIISPMIVFLFSYLKKTGIRIL